MKVCSSCSERKPLSAFGKNSCKLDGLCAACKVCRNARRRKYYSENRASEVVKAYTWNLKNPEKVKQNRRKNYKRNSEKFCLRVKQAYARSPEKFRSRMRKWRKENPAVCTALSAKKRAAKLRRTPGWLTENDFHEIRSFYRAAREATKETGVPHHVDHIYPLQGKFVSGLHVPLNLQVLTARENIAKKNKWTPS